MDKIIKIIQKASLVAGIIVLGVIGYKAEGGYIPYEKKDIKPSPVAVISEGEDEVLLDINSATPEELETLPGIGPVKARAIVELRRKMYGFHTVDDLLCVHGMGEKGLEKIRGYIEVKEYSP